MNPRYTPLQSWERAALNRYARQNGFLSPILSGFWHSYGALLRSSARWEDFHLAGLLLSATSRGLLEPSLLPAPKIEHRLYSLFAE